MVLGDLKDRGDRAGDREWVVGGFDDPWSDLDALETFSINGMKSAFLHYDERVRIIYERIKAPFAALREELGLPGRRPYGARS